jgi:fatty acyl-CoA reductase
MIKTLERGNDIKKVFEFFVMNEWIYESKKVKFLNDYMTPDERKTFIVDAADIDNDYFLVVNNYGLQKYILKENVELPSQENYNLLRLQS